MQQTAKPRLYFADNLRTFLIVLVILQHLAITYGSPTGMWYIHEGIVDLPAGFVYVVFLAVNQAFFMGLLFLLAGYFTPGSYDRKGAGPFLGDRALRLAIPIAVFIFLINPIMAYAINGFQVPLQDYLMSNPFVGLGFGPLWFIEALLFFTFAYMAWRIIKPSPTKPRPVPSNRAILLFGLLLGAVSFALRTVLPIGYVLAIPGFQIPFFPQYIALFIVGLIAYRSNWIQSMPKSAGQLWGKISVGLLLVFPVIVVTGTYAGGLGSFAGGWTWQAAAYAFWEQMFCIAVSVGLIVWFREKFNTQNRFTKALAESSYGAYLIQAPILVYLAIALQNVEMPLLLKFAIVSPFAVGLCFGTAYLLRKIPKADNIL